MQRSKKKLNRSGPSEADLRLPTCHGSECSPAMSEPWRGRPAPLHGGFTLPNIVRDDCNNKPSTAPAAATGVG